MKIQKINSYNDSWDEWNEEILNIVNIPSILYHVTDKKNLKDIYHNGLKMNSSRNTLEGYKKGIYLTSNPQRLIETTKDALWHSPITLVVNIDGLTLRFDPEFYNDYFDYPNKMGKDLLNGKIDFYMYSQNDIPVSNIKIV